MSRTYTWTNADGLTLGGGRRLPETSTGENAIDKEVAAVQSLAALGINTAPRHSLMRWQGLPINSYGGTMTFTANAWFGATFRSPVPITGARIALPVNAADAAAIKGYQAAFIQPLASGLPTTWPYQLNAGDGSGMVNVHNGGGGGNFTWDSVAASTDDSAYPSAVSGTTATVSSPAGATLSSGAATCLFWSDWHDLRTAPIQASDGWFYYGVVVQNNVTNTIPSFIGTAGKIKALLSNPVYANAQCLQLVDTYPLTNAGAFADWPIDTAKSLARASSGFFENSPVAALEVMTPARVLHVAGLCDSQLTGFSTSVTGATVESLGALKRACMAMSTASKLVQYVDTGMPGATTTQLAQSWLPGLERISPNAAGRGQSSIITGVWKPHVLFIQPSSANDNLSTPTTATIRQGFGKAIRLAELCRRNLIVPVLCTVPPALGRYNNTQTGGDMTTEAARRQTNTMLRNAAAADTSMKLLDTDLIVANNTPSISTLITAYNGGDGIHFSDAGNAAIAAAAQTILETLV